MCAGVEEGQQGISVSLDFGPFHMPDEEWLSMQKAVRRL